MPCLEDVAEANMSVWQGLINVGELLESEDDVVQRCVPPRTCTHKLGPDSIKLFILVDSLGRSLDVHDISGVDKSLCRLGRYCFPLLLVKAG